MSRVMVACAVAAAVAVPSMAWACDGAHDGPKNAALTEYTVEQVASLARERKVTPVDVNTAKTRAEKGVLPGAVLISSSTQYDPAKELSVAKDQNLVFYCYSESCGASEQAARRAVQAGYARVGVMRSGIMGWKKAGQPTDMPRS